MTEKEEAFKWILMTQDKTILVITRLQRVLGRIREHNIHEQWYILGQLDCIIDDIEHSIMICNNLKERLEQP